MDPLKRIAAIGGIARVHIQDMVKRGVYDHVDPDGRKVRYRFDQADTTVQGPITTDRLGPGGEITSMLQKRTNLS